MSKARKLKRGPRPKEGDVETFQLTIPKPLHAYLLYLARNTYAGASISEVVHHLLKRQIEAMGAKLEVPRTPPAD
jgi:hypothetical protein